MQPPCRCTPPARLPSTSLHPPWVHRWGAQRAPKLRGAVQLPTAVGTLSSFLNSFCAQPARPWAHVEQASNQVHAHLHESNDLNTFQRTQSKLPKQKQTSSNKTLVDAHEKTEAPHNNLEIFYRSLQSYTLASLL